MLRVRSLGNLEAVIGVKCKRMILKHYFKMAQFLNQIKPIVRASLTAESPVVLYQQVRPRLVAD